MPSARAGRSSQIEEPVAEKSSILGLDCPIGNKADLVHQAALESGAALRRVEPARAKLALPEHGRERSRRGEDLVESTPPRLANHRIGILSRRKAGKAQALTRAQQRQGPPHRPGGGTLSRCISIETEDRLGRQAPKLVQLEFGQRGSERRHCCGEARLMQRDHVHVPFGDDRPRAALSPSRMTAARAADQPYNTRPFSKSALSGEFRYLGCPSPSTRPPKAMTRPARSLIGNIRRLRK